MTPIRELRPSRPRRGFSAVEVIAVATIMAILALVLIPIIGNRVEKAKLVAAQEDLIGLGKAIALAQADTGEYFRLQDYDNTTRYTQDVTSADFQPWHEVPATYWETLQYFSAAERASLKEQWEGRYIAFTRTSTLRELYDSAAYGWACVRIVPDTGFPAAPGDNKMGPIVVFGFPGNSGTSDPRNEYNNPNTYLKNTHPVDPWGAPYLFFAPGTLKSERVTIYDSDYRSPILICLGPDNKPGSTSPTSSAVYLRTSSVLGTQDDIVHEF